jgi:hypothetical protein
MEESIILIRNEKNMFIDSAKRPRMRGEWN